MQVSIRPHGVTLEADGNDLYTWAHKPGAAWPCSVLAELDELRAHFDAHGLVDVDHPGVDDVPGDEFSAFCADALREQLPADHPAYFVTVGQFS